MAKNIDVITNFVARFKAPKAGNLYVEGDKLINYYTVIGQYINGQLYVNSTKYSVSTSKIQNQLRKEAYSYIELQDIPMGCQDLARYIPQNA
jgi:hypothetical protein